MPAIIEWGNDEHNVLMATIDWPWSWDELSATWKTGVELINSVNHDVHLILNAKTSRFPVGNILTNLTAITKNVPPNVGLAIIVTENRFQEAINNIFFKLSPRLGKKGRVVNSLEKAFELVAQETGRRDTVSE